jgi:hypothetical protein
MFGKPFGHAQSDTAAAAGYESRFLLQQILAEDIHREEA